MKEPRRGDASLPSRVVQYASHSGQTGMAHNAQEGTGNCTVRMSELGRIKRQSRKAHTSTSDNTPRPSEHNRSATAPVGTEKIVTGRSTERGRQGTQREQSSETQRARGSRGHHIRSAPEERAVASGDGIRITMRDFIRVSRNCRVWGTRFLKIKKGMS